MADIKLPNIPDVPEASRELKEFLRAVKETLEILTGRLGGNKSLIDYMKEHS